MLASYPNWVFTLFSSIGFLLCCIPFSWHFEARNVGTCLYMIWSGVCCLGYCINSIIWKGNINDWAPVWCDIFTRVIVIGSFGIPAASLCANRRIYLVASVRKVTVSRAEKRRQMAVDLAIGLGLPIIFLILRYVYQDVRYLIFEDIGCLSSSYQTWVEIILNPIPCFVLDIIAIIYAILGFCAFYKIHAQGKDMLSFNSSLNNKGFLRLMLLGATVTLFSLAGQIYVLVIDFRDGNQPWMSFKDIHADISLVVSFTAQEWRSGPDTFTIEFDRWIWVICAFIFSAFFAFSGEAMKHYRHAMSLAGSYVGISSGSSGNHSSSSRPKGGVDPCSYLHRGPMPELVKQKAICTDFPVSDKEFSDAPSISSSPPQQKWMLLNGISRLLKKSIQKPFKSNSQCNEVVLPDIGRILPGKSSNNISLASESMDMCSGAATSVPVDPHGHSHNIV